jgi:hypothetical protein
MRFMSDAQRMLHAWFAEAGFTTGLHDLDARPRPARAHPRRRWAPLLAAVDAATERLFEATRGGTRYLRAEAEQRARRLIALVVEEATQVGLGHLQREHHSRRGAHAQRAVGHDRLRLQGLARQRLPDGRRGGHADRRRPAHPPGPQAPTAPSPASPTAPTRPPRAAWWPTATSTACSRTSSTCTIWAAARAWCTPPSRPPRPATCSAGWSRRWRTWWAWPTAACATASCGRCSTSTAATAWTPPGCSVAAPRPTPTCRARPWRRPRGPPSAGSFARRATPCGG